MEAPRSCQNLRSYQGDGVQLEKGHHLPEPSPLGAAERRAVAREMIHGE